MNKINNKYSNKDLVERAKELNCLYLVDETLKDINEPLKDVLDKIVNVIPKGWRFNDICAAEIKCNDIHCKTSNFNTSILKQKSNIVINNKIIGKIIVCYTKPIKNQRVFLPEEQKLLNSITQKISNFISYQNLSEKIEVKTEKKQNNNPSLQELKNWLKFQSLNNNDIDNILNLKLNFNKGETICKQGSFATYIILLSDGYVKASIENNNKKTYNFKITKPFAFIGLSELFGTGYYHFSAVSLTSSSVYLIDIDQFKQLIAYNQEFSSNIMSWYCSNIENLYNKMSDLATKQSHGKIAEVLLYLSKNVFENSLISNIITRKDIANMTGISHESTVRILSEFKKDNIIKIVQSGIEIINFDLLKTISIAG